MLIESDYLFESSGTANCDDIAILNSIVGHVLPISCGPKFKATHTVLGKHARTLTGYAVTRCVERVAPGWAAPDLSPARGWVASCVAPWVEVGRDRSLP